MKTQDVQDFDSDFFDSDVDKYIFIVSYIHDRYNMVPSGLVDSIKLIDGTCDIFHKKIRQMQSKAKVRELVDSYINKGESHE